jgi:hypothetical protein
VVVTVVSRKLDPTLTVSPRMTSSLHILTGREQVVVTVVSKKLDPTLTVSPRMTSSLHILTGKEQLASGQPGFQELGYKKAYFCEE